MLPVFVRAFVFIHLFKLFNQLANFTILNMNIMPVAAPSHKTPKVGETLVRLKWCMVSDSLKM
jgi:hypothetical protein